MEPVGGSSLSGLAENIIQGALTLAVLAGLFLLIRYLRRSAFGRGLVNVIAIVLVIAAVIVGGYIYLLGQADWSK